jgi:putative membrane protein
VKRGIVLALVSVLAIAATASAAPSKTHAARGGAAAGKVSGLDTLFLTTSIQTDLAEIGTSKLALAESRNQRVRGLAQRLIADHTKMLASGRALASRLGIPAPTSPSPTQTWIAKVLAGLRGHVFNHWYASAQVAGHQEAIEITKLEVKAGSDATVRAVARTALPMLRAHLRLAKTTLRSNP